MIEILGALAPIAGWLGLGTVSSIGALVFGYFNPKRLFVSVITAAALAASMFFYAKGAHDDFTLQRTRETAAVEQALKRGEQARKDAERTVTAITKSSKPGKSGKPGERVRDVYDRDQSIPATKPKRNKQTDVLPVAPFNLFQR